MKAYWVWSGSLRGVGVQAPSAAEAVVEAVKLNLPCVLREAIRVSRYPSGSHETDKYFRAPYEETFPELFTGDLDVQLARVESQ